MKTANPEQTARRIKVSFSTDQYLRAHRASPKGRGSAGLDAIPVECIGNVGA